MNDSVYKINNLDNKIIKKFKYSDTSKYVRLCEYIFITYNNGISEKYLLLKLKNVFSQTLHAIKYEITQYDINDKTIDVAVFSYKDFSIKKGVSFSPYTKIILKNDCQRIAVKLISAEFSNGTVKDDVFTKYNRNDFITDKKVLKVRKVRLNTLSLKMMIISLFVIFIVCSAALLYIINDVRAKIESFTADALSYDVLSSTEVSIKSFDLESDITAITIPEYIYGYKVINIDESVFSNSSITSVQIESDEIIIGDSAFANCPNLKSFKAKKVTLGSSCFMDCISLETVVIENCATIFENTFANCSELKEFSSPNVEEVHSYAFKDCSKLEELNFEKATLSAMSLIGANFLKKLSFCDVSNDTIELGNLFGLNNVDLILELDLKIGSKRIYKEFFKNYQFMNSLELLQNDVFIEYGALEDCGLEFYEKTEQCEILDDCIISVNSEMIYLKQFVLNESALTMLPNVFLEGFNEVDYLEINIDYLVIPKNCLKNIRNFSILNLGNNTFLEKEALKGCYKLRNITMPICENNFSSLYTDELNIKSIKIIGSIDVPKRYFKNLYNLKELYIIESLNVSSDMVYNCPNILSLTIPNGENLSYYGKFENLTNVTLLPSSQQTLKNDLLKGLDKLVDVTFPNNITKCESYVLSKCPLLGEIYFPSAIADFDLPVVGYGCDSLIKVSIPTIPADKSYTDFNYSYDFTKELEIYGTGDLKYKADEYNLNIEKLIIKSNIDQCEKGFLSGYTNLNYLEVTNPNIDYFGQLFTNDDQDTGIFNSFVPPKLDTIKIMNLTYVPSRFFADCKNINNIILIGSYTIEEEAFNDSPNLRNIYLYDSVIRNFYTGLNSSTFNSTCNLILGNSKNDDECDNPKVVLYENIDYVNHTYNVHYDGNITVYTGLFINSFLDCIEENTDNLIVKGYKSSNYTGLINSPYFSVNDKDIYLLKDKFYTITAIEDKYYEVRFVDEDKEYKVVDLYDKELLDYFVPSKTGYIFSGWYTSSNLESQYLFSFNAPITSDLTLYAKWEKAPINNAVVINVDSVKEVNLDDAFKMCYAFMSVSSKELIVSVLGNSNVYIEIYSNDVLISQSENSGITGVTKIQLSVDLGEIYYIYVHNINSLAGEKAKISVLSIDPFENKGICECEGTITKVYEVPSSQPFTIESSDKDGWKIVGWFTLPNGKGDKYCNASGTFVYAVVKSDLTIYAYYEKK